MYNLQLNITGKSIDWVIDELKAIQDQLREGEATGCNERDNVISEWYIDHNDKENFDNKIEDPFLELNYHIVTTSNMENIITVRRLSDNDEFTINQKTKSGLIKKLVKDENASGGLYALMDSGSQVAINCIVL